MPRGSWLFTKALLGGVILTVVLWIAIVAYKYWQLVEFSRRQGFTGLMAVSGGQAQLLNTPWVLVVLTLGFGLGFYLVTLLARR